VIAIKKFVQKGDSWKIKILNKNQIISIFLAYSKKSLSKMNCISLIKGMIGVQRQFWFKIIKIFDYCWWMLTWMSVIW
jgi:hypothetical protein